MKRKIAIKAKYIYYNRKIHTDKYLLVNDKLIEGISDDVIEGDYKVIDRSSSGIFPGFFNTHTHLPMVYLRGIADDLPLKEWLENHIWPVENRILSEEFVYDATMLSIAEMIRSGVVCANDMYFFSKSIAKALSDAGLKGIVGGGVLDFPTKFARNFNEYLEKIEELIETFKGNELIKVSICPHAPYTVSPEGYRKCVEFATKHNILIHTHLSETKWERDEIIKRYNKTPVRLLEETGLFDTNSIFAHCVWLDDEEIDILGEKKVNIASCIKSNLKLASGIIKGDKLLKAGANITLGTDGNGSNNSLNMFDEMSTFSRVQKGVTLDPTVMPAETVFHMTTCNAAKALSFKNSGELKKGNFADFIVINFEEVNLMPVYNPISHLVYTSEPANVTDVFVNGTCLMENREFKTIDIEEIKNKAKYWSLKIRGLR